LTPLLTQDTFLVDQERAALDSHELASIHALLLVDAEECAQRCVFIRQKLERQLELRLELFVRGDAIRRYADDHRPCPLELAVELGKPLRLERATARVVLGIEIEDELLAARVAETPSTAAGHRSRKCGHLFAHLNRLGNRLSYHIASVSRSR